jgi:GGDEF domain-containing protein/2'-5' RNA ligase
VDEGSANSLSSPQPPAGFELAKTDNLASSPKPPAGFQIDERRSDIAQRKKVDEMSPEEMKRELLTSPVTNMPNRRAFDEAEQTPAPAVGMSDADGLKALNDKYGYDAGNGLLKLKAEALREAGLDAYHEKGDEFLYRGQSTKELQSKLEKAREILRNKTITVKMKDGSTVQLKGADFSYGTGKELTAAETGLKSHKSEREARGERARGELRGITQVGSEQGGQHPVRERPGSENKPQEVKTLAGQTPNRDKFRIAYTRHLERAVDLYPDQYGYGKDQVPKVVEKMINALAKGSANKDSLAIKATLKELKIKNTKGAISEYLRETQPAKAETKYKFGSTQANIPAGSDASKALGAARERISKDDLMPTGFGGNQTTGLEDDPHVTVRYGIKSDDTTKIKEYLERQAPFEATLGKTSKFPASKHSDGAAPIIAPIDAPELHRIEKELDSHGDFEERSFPEYKPHATVAYVKPEAADKYVGMDVTDGKKFRVDRIAISDKNGDHQEVELKGKAPQFALDEDDYHDLRKNVFEPALDKENGGRILSFEELRDKYLAYNASDKGQKEPLTAQSFGRHYAEGTGPAYFDKSKPKAPEGADAEVSREPFQLRKTEPVRPAKTLFEEARANGMDAVDALEHAVALSDPCMQIPTRFMD